MAKSLFSDTCAHMHTHAKCVHTDTHTCVYINRRVRARRHGPYRRGDKHMQAPHVWCRSKLVASHARMHAHTRCNVHNHFGSIIQVHGRHRIPEPSQWRRMRGTSSACYAAALVAQSGAGARNGSTLRPPCTASTHGIASLARDARRRSGRIS
jgi:hypothetical protein